MLLTDHRRLQTVQRHPSSRGHEAVRLRQPSALVRRRRAGLGLLAAAGAAYLLPQAAESVIDRMAGESPAAEARSVEARLASGEARPIPMTINHLDDDNATPGSIAAAVKRARVLNERGELVEAPSGNIHVFNKHVAEELFRRSHDGNAPLAGREVVVGYEDLTEAHE
jgi:hypothetical protein